MRMLLLTILAAVAGAGAALVYILVIDAPSGPGLQSVADAQKVQEKAQATEAQPAPEPATEPSPAAAPIALPEPAPQPAGLNAAEDALVTENTAVLVHLDADRAVALERAILGPEDPQALLSPALYTAGPLARIQAAGVDLRRSLQDMVLAVLMQGDKAAIAAVWFGSFAVEQIREAIATEFMVESGKAAGHDMLILMRQDENTCEALSPVAVVLAPDRIVIGTPEVMPNLLQRLDDKAPAARDLTAWRAYRDSRLLSLVLFAPPSDLAQTIDDPTARLMTSQAEDDIDDVESLQAGLRVEVEPVQLLLDTEIKSRGPAWPSDMATAFEDWRRQVREDYAAELPSLGRLLDLMTVAAVDNRLQVTAAIDERLLFDFAQLMAEFMRLIFRGLGADTSGSAQIQPISEQTLDPAQLKHYEARVDLSALQAFDPALDQTFKAQVATGPFGLRVKALRLTDEGFVEIEVEANSGPLANLGSDSMHQDDDDPRAQLVLTEVVGRDGRNLLREERCGQQRNDEAAALQPRDKTAYVNNEFITYPAAAGSKRVRLVEGAKLSDIAAIKGYVQLRLPIRVETLRIDAPFDGQSVERPGLRLAFVESRDGIQYEASGRIDRLLELRALNDAGAYLAGAGSFSSGRFFGSGKTISKSFADVPVVAELIVAVEEETERYTFEIAPVTVAFNTWDYPPAHVVEAQSVAQFEQLYGGWTPEKTCEEPGHGGNLGLAQLCVRQFLPSFGTAVNGQFAVATPPSRALRKNLTGVKLLVDRLYSAGREEPWGFELEGFLQLSGFGSDQQHDNGMGDYLNGEISTEGLQADQITGAAGRLMLRLPASLANVTLDLQELGSEAAGEGVSARFTEIADGAIGLTIQGERDRIVQYLPRDVTGRVLATNSEYLTHDEDKGLWRAMFRVSGQPTTADVVVATEVQELEYPFDFRWRQ